MTQKAAKWGRWGIAGVLVLGVAALAVGTGGKTASSTFSHTGTMVDTNAANGAEDTQGIRRRREAARRDPNRDVAEGGGVLARRLRRAALLERARLRLGCASSGAHDLSTEALSDAEGGRPRRVELSLLHFDGEIRGARDAIG